MAQAKNAVAKKDEAKLPAAGFDYGDDAGSGFEGTTQDDLSIPFLSILQSNSPQVEENDPEGCRPGMLFNTVTKELVDGEEGLIFQPVHKDHQFVEWIPRNKGGGFVGMYEPDSPEVKKAVEDNGGQRMGKLTIGDNELIETHYVYGLILDNTGENQLGFAVVTFNSTKIKPCKDWFTAMYMLKGKPPLFANRARLRTVKQKNEHGTFFNFTISPLSSEGWAASLINPQANADLLDGARSFREMVLSGKAQADFSKQNATTGEGGNDPEDPPF